MVMSSGMGSAVLGERLPALWRCIEDAHYVYLEIDDSPEKLKQKKKLEGYIMEYLSLVPHECKFGLSETGKVFQRTISELRNYSAYRAGLGWAALGRYASNLLSQPWRKEYRTIRLYCGYFKHEVEANMVGAEILLHQLGYKPSGGGRLVLDGPVCPDMVAAISRDALIAHVECQIMSHVWEAVWGTGNRVTWSEVARERSRRIGDAASTAARLAAQATVGARRRTYEETEIYSNVPATVADSYHNTRISEPISSCDYSYQIENPPEEPIVPIVHQTSYMAPPNMVPQNIAPQNMVPQNMVPQNVIYTIPHHIHPDVPVTVPVMTPYGAVPYYYAPVQTPYMIPTPVYAPIKHATTLPVNGYTQIPQCRVPTGQLIEFDAPSVYENGKHDRHIREVEERNHSRKRSENETARHSSKSGFSDASIASLPRSDTQPVLSKAREDGMGTYESWDYVFRNLSSKDHDRGRFSPSLERDSRTLDRYDRDERRSRYQPTTLDLEDGLHALNLDRSHDDEVYRTAKVNENLMRMKQESEIKKSRHLAKKLATEERTRKKPEPVGNPESDALVPTKIAPDKVKLLTKKDIKDRKDVIKQQNSVNGTAKAPPETRRPRKPSRSDDKGVRIKVSLENGHAHAAHSSKSAPVSSNPSSINHSYEAKTLVVSLDEADSVRTSPPKSSINGDDRPSSRNSRQNGAIDVVRTTEEIKNVKWECATCTYINNSSVSACEMCGKSKVTGPEVLPLTSGGRECPACTLVNNRDATVCEACGNDLKHCPTYI